MGEIGIPHKVALYDVDMCDIRLIIRGYSRRERAQYINTRWLIFSIAKMMGGAKDVDTPEEFCPFAWEKKSEKEEEEDKAQLEKLLEEARQYNDSLEKEKD